MAPGMKYDARRAVCVELCCVLCVYMSFRELFFFSLLLLREYDFNYDENNNNCLVRRRLDSGRREERMLRRATGDISTCQRVPVSVPYLGWPAVLASCVRRHTDLIRWVWLCVALVQNVPRAYISIPRQVTVG